MAAAVAAAAAASGGEQQAAAPEANARRLLPTLDPRLFMAARRGDSGLLKDLLRIDDEEEEEGTAAGASATAADAGDVPVPVAADEVVVDIQVDPPDAAVAPPAPPAPDDDVASDGDQEQGTRDGTPSTTAAGLSMADGMVDHEAVAPAGEDDMVVDHAVDHPQPPHDDVAPPPPPPPTAAAENGDDTSVASPPAQAASRLLEEEDGLTTEGDSLLHVVAACGDSPEFLRCAKMIVRHKEKNSGAAAAKRLALLEARNNDGDTPLHCAAGAGNAAMIECLLGLLPRDEPAALKAFVRMQNDRGETALHHAVKWACMKGDNRRRGVVTENNEWTSVIHANRLVHSGCIGKLVAVDADLASMTTHEGTSPLYLAISLGQMEIARYLLVTSKEEGNLSYYSGPGGQNILHAAVSRGDVQELRMVMKWIKDVKTTAGMGMQGVGGQPAAAVDDLLSQLTSQRDDRQKGSTPLHLAASLDGWPAFRSRRKGRLPREVRPAAATLLLDANVSMAYQPDDEGSYPVHSAAWCGSLDGVKKLIQECPDCATLRDGKGRTFLQVAAEEKRYRVVKYVCESPPDQFASILNAQDKNGDTAVHGAVRSGNVAVFNSLFRNRQVRLDVANKDGMTPLDLSRIMVAGRFTYAFDPRHIARVSLLLAGAPHGGGRPELFRERHMPKKDENNEEEERRLKKFTEATQVMSIVTALIATVTFASAFTLPGGYRADNGVPVLAGSYAFDAFILADTLAFICSCLATFSLVYAGMPSSDRSMRQKYFIASWVLLCSAQRSFVSAFALGLYLVLAPLHHPAAVAVSVIISASLLWGHRAAWKATCMVYTVTARIGIRPFLVYRHARGIFWDVLRDFGSYIIIFGLPAIRKRAS